VTLLDERFEIVAEETAVPAPVSLQARTGRWRVSARLARREMRRRPWRALLAVLMIAVPVAAMVCADVAYRSDQIPADRALAFGTADARLVGDADMNEHRSEIEAQFPAGTTWTWNSFFYAPLRSTAAPDDLVDAVVIVRDLADPLAAGMVRALDGRLPTADDEVLLSRSLAAAFDVSVGDGLTLVRPAQTFTVVGIGDVRPPYLQYPSLLAPGFDLTAIRPDAISYEVLLKGPAFVNESAPPPTYEVTEPETGDTYIQAAFFETPTVPSTDGATLVLGWVFGVMLMGVLGIVVAAAFAVSGRRQLVTIGQLSATGADPGLLRRFLALQGTWTGLIGAALGVGGGLLFVQQLDQLFRNDGRLALQPADWAIVGVTAMAVATIAAVVPTRSLATVSVLSALGGRRPVPPVRRRQLPIGAGLVAGGLAVLFASITVARDSNDTGGDLAIPTIFAALGGISLLVGVCCLCPLAVDAISRFGARRRGVAMLATRSLGRHRARAAALLAAIIAVGAGATAVAAAGEQEIKNQRRSANEVSPAADIIWLQGIRFDRTTGSTVLTAPDLIDPAIRGTVEAVVGTVTWVEASSISDDPRTGTVFIASDDLLAQMGLSIDQRADLSSRDHFVLTPGPVPPDRFLWATPALGLGRAEPIVIPGLHFGYFTPMVSPRLAAERGLVGRAYTLFGRADHQLGRAEVDRIFATRDYAAAYAEEQVFVGLDRTDDTVDINIQCCDSQWEWLTWMRLGTIGGALLLIALIVGLGMALWAAEGRDERDTLVAIGAGPSTLAAIAGLKAWLLAFVGALVAVPLGFGTLRLAVRAAHQPATFPWVFAGALIVVLPLVIGAVTLLGSRIAQHARPVRASTALAD
jgi:hypothetical protein